jgi:hypothetical protein
MKKFVFLILSLQVAVSQELPLSVQKKSQNNFYYYTYDLGDSFPCFLELALPFSSDVKGWIHPATLLCSKEGSLREVKLGHLEYRRSYQGEKLILRGEAAALLRDLLKDLADPNDIQSVVSSRKIAWGPRKSLFVYSLRKKSDEGNLSPSLECFEERNEMEHSEALSCAVSSERLGLY